MGAGPSFNPTIQDIFVRDHGTVPDWRDVIAEEDRKARKDQLTVCARAVWQLLSRKAMSADTSFTPATLHVNGVELSLGTPGDGGIPGWRWDGIMIKAVRELWPSLWTGKAADPHNTEDAERMTFRIEMSRYLRSTRNACLIKRGGAAPDSDDNDDKAQPSTWFISSTWNDEAVPVPLPSRNPEQLRKEKKLTATEAGENRQPSPVTAVFACRRAACKSNPRTFAKKSDRDAHELTHDAKTFKCRGCGLPYTSTLGRKSHEEKQHPVLFAKLYTIQCPFPGGCPELFEPLTAAASLGHHLGKAGHGLEKDERNRLIRQALEETHAVPQVQASTTSVTEPEPAPKAVTRQAEPIQAKPSVVAAPATPASDMSAEDQAIAYLTGLMDRERQALLQVASLAAENAVLKAERDELQAKLTSMKDVAKLIETIRGTV